MQDQTEADSMESPAKRSGAAGSEDNAGRLLFVNILSNWVPLCVNLLVGFLLTPYLISSLGKEHYGIWALSGSFVGYYGLLRLGVGVSIMRYVPYYRGLNDQRAVNEVVSTAMAIFILAGLVICSISIIGSEAIARFFRAGSEFALVVRILGVAAALECPARVLDACVRAHERWVPANFVSIVISLFRAIALASCLYLGYGLEQLGYVILVTATLSLILSGILFRLCCGTVALRISSVRPRRAMPLISFGLVTNLGTMIYSLRLAGHSLIIGKVISLEAVTVYAVAVILMKNVRLVTVAPTRVFWPRFAHLDGSNKRDEMRRFFFNATRFCAFLASCVILIVITIGPSFIHLWVGEGFSEVYLPLMILAVGYLIEASLGSSIPFLGGTGHQKAQALIGSIETIIGFGLSILLAIRLKMVGVALGFLISSVITNGFVCSYYICRLLNVRIIRYYVECLVRPWLICGILTFAFRTLRIKNTVDWSNMIFAGFMLGTIYTISSYYFTLRDEEREKIKNIMRKYWSRLFRIVAKH